MATAVNGRIRQSPAAKHWQNLHKPEVVGADGTVYHQK